MPARVVVDVEGVLVSVRVEHLEPIVDVTRPIAVGDRVRFMTGEYAGSAGEVRVVLAED